MYSSGGEGYILCVYCSVLASMCGGGIELHAVVFPTSCNLTPSAQFTLASSSGGGDNCSHGGGGSVLIVAKEGGVASCSARGL